MGACVSNVSSAAIKLGPPLVPRESQEYACSIITASESEDNCVFVGAGFSDDISVSSDLTFREDTTGSLALLDYESSMADELQHTSCKKMQRADLEAARYHLLAMSIEMGKRRKRRSSRKTITASSA